VAAGYFAQTECRAEHSEKGLLLTLGLKKSLALTLHVNGVNAAPPLTTNLVSVRTKLDRDEWRSQIHRFQFVLRWLGTRPGEPRGFTLQPSTYIPEDAFGGLYSDGNTNTLNSISRKCWLSQSPCSITGLRIG
jgi:hypothetical protein